MIKTYRVRVADCSGDGKDLGVYSSLEKSEKVKARWERRQVKVHDMHFLGGVYFPKTCESIYSRHPYEHKDANIHNLCVRHAHNLMPKDFDWNWDDECFIIEETVK